MNRELLEQIWILPLHHLFSIRVPTYGSGGEMELASISPLLSHSPWALQQTKWDVHGVSHSQVPIYRSRPVPWIDPVVASVVLPLQMLGMASGRSMSVLVNLMALSSFPSTFQHFGFFAEEKSIRKNYLSVLCLLFTCSLVGGSHSNELWTTLGSHAMYIRGFCGC